MGTKKQIKSFLSTNQIKILTEVVIDQFGSELPEEELVDSIALVLEDVPGIEMESSQSIQYVINLIRNRYYGNGKR